MSHSFKKIENLSSYTQVELQFSEIICILKSANIHLGEHIHNPSGFIDTIVSLTRKDFPINANLFLTSYESLSPEDQSIFFRMHIRPILSETTEKRVGYFCNRVGELLEIHG